MMIFILFPLFFLIISAIAFDRAKDLYVAIHVVKIVNFYIFPLFLMLYALDKMSILVFAKTLIIIILNILFSMIICHFFIRKAIEEQILPDADS